MDIKQFYISCAVINRLFSKYIGHDFDLLWSCFFLVSLVTYASLYYNKVIEDLICVYMASPRHINLWESGLSIRLKVDSKWRMVGGKINIDEISKIKTRNSSVWVSKFNLWIISLNSKLQFSTQITFNRFWDHVYIKLMVL